MTTAEDCYILNCALAELGYLVTGEQPNSFTPVTQGAVEWFQGEHNLEVDGMCGPITKVALAGELAKARKLPAPITGRVYCRLTRTGKPAHSGLELLLLEFISPKGNVLESLDVVSGAPGKQVFRALEDKASVAGNLEPIPQSRYFIADIEWAGGKDNYKAEHPHENNGIGPVFVPLVKTKILGRDNERDAFGFHADWNFIVHGHSPGSAGCVCPTSIKDLKELVRLLRLYDPRDLFVDWKLR